MPDTHKPIRVVVVGGGITGLACAYRLQNRLSILGRPFEITLIESSNRLGGIIETIRRDQFLIEKGPDAFLSEKPRGMGLANELAITNLLLQTQPENRRSFILKENNLRPIPRGFHILAPTDILEMMTTRLLTLKGKARLLKEFFVPIKPPTDESLGSFVSRRFGPEVLQHLAQPIVNAIYGADPGALSMRATFPHFLQLEEQGSLLLSALKGSREFSAAQASGARYSLMMSFKDGMQTLVDHMANHLRSVTIQRGVSAARLSVEGERWKIKLSNAQEIEADGICVTLSAESTALLLQDLFPALSNTLREIPHADSLSAYYAVKKSLIGNAIAGSGLLVPEVERKSFTACTLVHNKFSDRAPKEFALLRAFAGGKAANALWSMSDDEIQRRIFADLKAILKIRGTPEFTEIFRYRKGLPHYTVGHLDRIETIKKNLAALPTLALGGNWRQGVGIPDCIDSGERAADQVIMDLCQI